ncbi:hypothetical protein SBADM41S_02426 [Streptomyces badius]
MPMTAMTTGLMRFVPPASLGGRQIVVERAVLWS